MEEMKRNGMAGKERELKEYGMEENKLNGKWNGIEYGIPFSIPIKDRAIFKIGRNNIYIILETFVQKTGAEQKKMNRFSRRRIPL